MEWWEALTDLAGIGTGRSRRRARTYVDGERRLPVAVSKAARRRIGDSGNRVWVWADGRGSYALVKASASAPVEQRRYVRLTDHAEPASFAIMLEDGLEPLSLDITCRPWPARGLSVGSVRNLG